MPPTIEDIIKVFVVLEGHELRLLRPRCLEEGPSCLKAMVTQDNSDSLAKAKESSVDTSWVFLANRSVDKSVPQGDDDHHWVVCKICLHKTKTIT